MKKLLIILGLIISAGCTNAQNNKQNIENIPPFKILKADSTWFTAANLKKHKPVMIIYFSPDCSHCQHLMYEMKPKMKAFGNTQIVMVTFMDYNLLRMVKNFVRDFDLAKYPNITVGTEGHTYVVQRYYQVRSTPYIAVYDRKGKLVQAFEKSPTMDELIAAVKKT
ncbi:MAG TPA: thioredoxin fold domain-containing protein [Mucilaginibacter sp.]|nr:thioredoxin fold domain-containing protein [Mucilaginibacter sp.]